MFSVEYNLLVCPARIFKIHYFCLSQWPKLMSAIYPLRLLIGFTPRMNLAAQDWNKPVLHLNGYSALNTGQCLMAERQMKLFLIKLSSGIRGWQGKKIMHFPVPIWVTDDFFLQIQNRSINCQSKTQGENTDSVGSPFWGKMGRNWRHQSWRQPLGQARLRQLD